MDELIGKLKVQQWEYEMVKNSEHTQFQLLVDMGKDGWEFCGDAFIQGCRYLIFKRPLP